MEITSSGNVHSFGVLDYIIFCAMLVATTFTGLYHAFAESGQNTTSRFLMADRSMFSLPVAVSLLASFCSVITILGIPAEIFKHGIQFWNIVWTNFLAIPITAMIFIPVFYDLQVVSAYEYLHRRFNMLIRVLGATLFILQTVFYLAIVMFASALALEVVANIEEWKTILITGLICIFYTTLGGIKGVIWTNVFQFTVLFGSLIAVMVFGTNNAGGINHVWNYNDKTGHLNFIVSNPDPFMRLNIWSVVIGGTFSALPIWAISQISVQRFLTASSLTYAQRSLWYILFGNIIIVSVGSFCGMVIYAYYDGTTPSRQVPDYSSIDQIIIYFVSQEFGSIPGIKGLFVACLFAATSSVVSSGLNSLAAVTLTDVIKPIRSAKEDYDENTDQDKSDTKFAKLLTCIYGIANILIGILSSKLGSLIQVANTVFGAIGGPLLGIFSLGMLYRRANSGGALIGLLSGFLLALWITIGALLHTEDGVMDPKVFALYRLSFLWYSMFAFLATFIVGIATSEIIRCGFVDEQQETVDFLTLATFLRPKGGTQSPGEGDELEMIDPSTKLLAQNDEDGIGGEDEKSGAGMRCNGKHYLYTLERSYNLKNKTMSKD